MEAKKTPAKKPEPQVKPFTKTAQTHTEKTTPKPAPTQAPAPTPTLTATTQTTPTNPPAHEPPESAPVTLESLKTALDTLRIDLLAQTVRIDDLQTQLALKRRPAANGNAKVQIKDITTNKVYPSKNNTYKSLLKSGELKDLIAQGVFGADPGHNSFGWYALNRAFPNRFVEIKAEAPKS